MFDLISFLIFGHIHKWEIYAEAMTRNNVRVFYLRCEKCGNIKRKTWG